MRSWASILDPGTKEQALAIARSPAVEGHVALMPDAHLGRGATVGSVIRTRGAIIPAAVGVDLGCGMIAIETGLERGHLRESEAVVLRRVRETIPSGVGRDRPEPLPEAHAFIARRGWFAKAEGEPELRRRALAQFGTLGAGNHFAEVCADTEGGVWCVVHSGSRGVGNQLAMRHIARARAFCQREGLAVEHADLSYLVAGTPEFEAYVADMLWAQDYARAQREAMMTRLLEAVARAASKALAPRRTVDCHHNYSTPWGERGGEQLWLSRKGAIAAGRGVLGIIPGSMGAATYVVSGLANAEAYESAPHGAGRQLSRGQAKRTLSLDAFRAQMRGRTWQARDARALLDEAPEAYKPIEVVIADASELAEPVTVLSQFVNYKGL